MLAHRGLRLVMVASLILAFTGYAAFDSGLPAFATVQAHVSAHSGLTGGCEAVARQLRPVAWRVRRPGCWWLGRRHVR